MNYTINYYDEKVQAEINAMPLSIRAKYAALTSAVSRKVKAAPPVRHSVSECLDFTNTPLVDVGRK